MEKNDDLLWLTFDMNSDFVFIEDRYHFKS